MFQKKGKHPNAQSLQPTEFSRGDSPHLQTSPKKTRRKFSLQKPGRNRTKILEANLQESYTLGQHLCQQLGGSSQLVSHEKAIWKGSHNLILKELTNHD